MKLLSSAIKVATVFTMGGAASAIASLLLARHLSTLEFGEFSLVLAIATFSLSLGPLSLDEMVLRGRPGPHRSLLRNSTITGVIGGALIVLLTWFFYDIDNGFLPFLAITVAAGSIARVGASVYQSEREYTWSLWLVQSQNLTLILAAIAAGVFAGITATAIFSVYAVHWMIAAVVAWVFLRLYSKFPVQASWQAPWNVRAPLFGHMLTIQLFATLDRLLIPKLLGIESLATFSVLMVLVMSPFKMFELAVGYTLIPGLRNVSSRSERNTLLFHEARTAVAVTILAIFSGFLIAPWVKNLVLGDKYELGAVLIAAAVFSGAVKVAAIFLSSIVTALGDQHQLSRLNRGAWFSLGIAILGAWLGSHWGLPGLVAGFAVGSLLRIMVAVTIARQVL